MVKRRTLFSLVCVSQLLQSTDNLFEGRLIASFLQDIIRDELVPVWESAEGFCSSWIGGLIAGQALRGEGKMGVEITRKVMCVPSNNATSR